MTEVIHVVILVIKRDISLAIVIETVLAVVPVHAIIVKHEIVVARETTVEIEIREIVVAARLVNVNLIMKL
jgi:hypothetical protein